MRELALLAIGAGLLACGIAWGQMMGAPATAAIAADNAELRQTAKTLRQRCPSQPLFQREPMTKGLPV